MSTTRFLPTRRAFSTTICLTTVVGYQLVSVPAGWSVFTPTFKDVGGTDFDLKDVVPCDASGNVLTSSKNKITVQKLSADGSLLVSYSYTTASNKGWHLNNVAISKGDVVFADGEGIAVNNVSGSALTFRVAGAVDLVCRNVIPTGWSFSGNSTPVRVDLKNIVPCDATGTPLTSSKNKITVQKLGTEGSFDLSYSFTTASNKGWHLNNVAINEGEVVFEPGEAFGINNVSGAVVILQLPSPVTNN